jgi:hypothetical protein
VPVVGEYQESLRSGISTALVRLRDYDLKTKDSLTQELAQAAEFLDQAAQLAMAAMLQVGSRAKCGVVYVSIICGRRHGSKAMRVCEQLAVVQCLPSSVLSGRDQSTARETH